MAKEYDEDIAEEDEEESCCGGGPGHHRHHQQRDLDNDSDDDFESFLDEDNEESSDDEDEGLQRPSDYISEERLNDIFDKFLEKTDIKGKRMIERVSPAAQVDAIRNELREVLTDKYRIEAELSEDDGKDGKAMMEMPVAKERCNWDCETIISTYSNIYNHPKFIEETRTSGGKIVLGKDGMPLGAMAAFREKRRLRILEKQGGGGSAVIAEEEDGNDQQNQEDDEDDDGERKLKY